MYVDVYIIYIIVNVLWFKHIALLMLYIERRITLHSVQFQYTFASEYSIEVDLLISSYWKSSEELATYILKYPPASESM